MDDKVAKFQKLQKKATSLKEKKIELETQYKTKKESLKDLVKEVKDMGYDPNKLGQIIKQKEEALDEQLESFEKDITEVSNKLAEIEG